MKLVSKTSVTQKTVESQITSAIESAISKKVLGNSRRGLQALCQDLINNSTMGAVDIAHEAFLHPATVKKLASGETKYPRADTCERILRTFEVALYPGQEQLKMTYRNQKK